MNVKSPKDMQNGLDMLDQALEKFDSKLYNENKDSLYYHLVISGELPRSVCEAVKQKYLDAGWTKVECKTSSENGERPGLTGLQLWI